MRPTCNGGYPLIRVKGCNCGWGYPHEPGCGWDIDDRAEPRHPLPGWQGVDVVGGNDDDNA